MGIQREGGFIPPTWRERLRSARFDLSVRQLVSHNKFDLSIIRGRRTPTSLH